jgi:hypothetical protein
MVYNRLSIDNLNVARRMVEDGVRKEEWQDFLMSPPA